MNTESVVRIIPLFVFLGAMIWLLGRSKRFYRLQDASVARQQEMAPKILESLNLQRAGLEIDQKQLETSLQLLDEIKALRNDLSKPPD